MLCVFRMFPRRSGSSQALWALVVLVSSILQRSRCPVPLTTFTELIIFHSLLVNKFIQKIQGEKGRKCVVKIEPHENGPLFVEWHYYLAAGR